MRKRKLTVTQELLLDQLKVYISTNNGLPYNTLKSLCGGSFDKSFNAILEKGWVERVETNDYSNQFKLTP